MTKPKYQRPRPYYATDEERVFSVNCGATHAARIARCLYSGATVALDRKEKLADEFIQWIWAREVNSGSAESLAESDVVCRKEENVRSRNR